MTNSTTTKTNIKKGYSFIHPEHGLSWIVDSGPCAGLWTVQTEDATYRYFLGSEEINEYPEGDAHKSWLQFIGWSHAVRADQVTAGDTVRFNSGSTSTVSSVETEGNYTVITYESGYTRKAKNSTFIAISKN